MKQFTVVPIYTQGMVRYNAPTFYVNSDNSKNAQEEAVKNSGLSRFPEWSFHVIETSKDNNSEIFKSKSKLKVKQKIDKNSKSQRGKVKTGHSNSRPVRRGLRRLAVAKGYCDNSMKMAGAIKMW